MKYINKIGVEVETALASLNLSSVRYLKEVKNDGSIHCEEGYAKEVVSEATDLRNIYEFLDSLKRYILVEQVNESMGFHIHISFNRHYYFIQIFSRDFINYFLDKLKKEFSNYYKLQRRFCNSYCGTYYSDSYFTKMYSSSRYKAVNIIKAYNRHKTVEFRIFNSSDVKTMKKYVSFTVRAINKYLDKNLKSMFSISETVIDDNIVEKLTI